MDGAPDNQAPFFLWVEHFAICFGQNLWAGLKASHFHGHNLSFDADSDAHTSSDTECCKTL